MSKLWLPNNVPSEALDLFVEIEYLKYQIKTAEHKNRYARSMMNEAAKALESIKSNESFLRQEARIVSMREFGKVKNLLEAAKSSFKTHMKLLAESDHNLKELKDKLKDHETKLEKITTTKKVIRIREKRDVK